MFKLITAENLIKERIQYFKQVNRRFYRTILDIIY